MGIDPVTHQPRTDVNVLRSLNQILMNPNIGGLWDNALRLQVDVTQLARMQLLQSLVQALSNNINAPPPINFSVMNPMGFVPLTQNQQAYDDVLQRIGGLVNNTVPDFGVSSQPSNNLQTVVNAANTDFDVKDINITNEVGASPEIVNGKEHVDAINDDFGGANPSMYSQFETWDTLNFDVQFNDQYCIMDQ
ncbi:hypothetical protein QJS10_CPB20g01224 [Acorus calamus]|uniref:Uncharacterized protein n=1 Tax=Acorus calamus TaxID=4465 RepID=A0AAV9C7X8_ACOCL|nr:hypothetical protein QJS10_CPB20g01224 [Acorus calamus]